MSRYNPTYGQAERKQAEAVTGGTCNHEMDAVEAQETVIHAYC